MAGTGRGRGGAAANFPAAGTNADRAPSKAQMKQVLLSLGLSQTVVDEVVDEQELETWSDWDNLEDADIDSTIRRASSRSGNGVDIPLKQAKTIKGIAYTHNLLKRMGRKTRCTVMTTAVLDVASLQHKVDKSWKDSDVRITPFDPNKEKEPAEYLRQLRPKMDSQRGVLNSPLSYLIRDEGTVEDEDDEESFLWSNDDFPSVDAELVRRSPIYETGLGINPSRLEGPWADSFLTDCRKGLTFLITAFGRSDVKIFAQQGFDEGNPRLIWLLLFDYFHGPGYTVVEQSTIRQTLDSLRYPGDTRTMTFINILSKLRHLYGQAETLAKTSGTAFNGIGIDPYEKCTILQRIACGCTALVPTVTAVRVNTAIAGDYTEQERAILAGYRSVVDANLREHGNRKIAAVVAGGGGGGGGGYKSLNQGEVDAAKKRLGKYSNPKTRVPQAEYDNFTPEEKQAKYLLNQDYLKKHPRASGGGGGGGGGAGRSARRRAHGKAKIAELQTQVDKLSKRMKAVDGTARDAPQGGDNGEHTGRQPGPARRHDSHDE